MSTLVLVSRSLEETLEIGNSLATLLQPGDVIGLVGDLGAGKTHLVQAVTAGLGVSRDLVNSPTFLLIQEYEGRIPVIHIDAYRLMDVDEFLELGAEELLGGDGICLIEWADRVAEALPRDRLTIRFAVCGASERQLEFEPSGPRSRRIVDLLRTHSSS